MLKINKSKRALLVQLRGSFDYNFCYRQEEFIRLVISANMQIVGFISGSSVNINPRFFVGKGKLEEIKDMIKSECPDIIIFNHLISPSQQKALKMYLKIDVIDRTYLILDIFAKRAKTFEGKLQVELAQMQYLYTHLVGEWTHLERQKGGIGLRGGPGEKQLESDRRVIKISIKNIKGKLEKVRNRRKQSRIRRERSKRPIVVLVGYTNSGKSTIFNELTNAKIFTADKLFATLDPIFRKVYLSDNKYFMLADTVGFISDIPHELINAFKATLEEIESADLLLNVVDCSSKDIIKKIYEVRKTLSGICTKKIPEITIFNKSDLINIEPKIIKSKKFENIVFLSAKERMGIDLLITEIEKKLKCINLL